MTTEYRPPVSKGSFGVSGRVKIVDISDGRAKVAFFAADDKGMYTPEPTDKIYIDEVNIFPVARTGQWMGRLSDKKDKLFDLRPVSGVYEGVYKEFVAKKDTLPEPYKMTTQFGDKYIFRPLFVLTAKEVEGMIVGYQWGLAYNFKEFPNPEEGKPSVAGYSKNYEKSPPTRMLDDFMCKTGAWDKGAMAWQENLLPKIHRRLVEVNRHVLIHVENGYIESLITLQDNKFSDEEEKVSEGVEE